MPGNLQPASPVTVLPAGLCSAFEQARTYEAAENTYANGESQREARASSARRVWRQSRKLSAARLTELIDFYKARGGGVEPFYLYDPSESTPYGNHDVTGVSTNGRFVGRFEGPLGFTLQLGRGEVTFTIREVA